MSKDHVFGFDLLCEQVLNHVRGEMHYLIESANGDSEIEKLFITALLFQSLFITHEHKVWPVYSLQDMESILNKPTDYETWLIVFPQAQIDDYRVDFLIQVLDLGKWFPDKKTAVWQKLIVECDGHNFHERTKEQAARDRKRDRDLQLKGYEVFRFTGSELWRDPIGCTDAIFEWAMKYWCWG